MVKFPWKQAGLVKCVWRSKHDLSRVTDGVEKIKMGQVYMWKQAVSRVSEDKNVWGIRQDW